MEPRYPAVPLGTALLLTTPVHADDGEWKHELAPYVWGTASLTLRGDIGGFGVLAAYRYLDMDYEDGKGRNFFKCDMAISGPALGGVFTF